MSQQTAWTEYLSDALSEIVLDSETEIYYEAFVNSDRMTGNCGSWQSWENAVTVQAFTEVLARVEFTHLTGRNWTSGEVGTKSTCEEKPTLKKMASFISNIDSYALGQNLTAPCWDTSTGGTTDWILKKCDNDNFGLCANCTDPCVADACRDFAVSSCSSHYTVCQDERDAINIIGAYFTSEEPLPVVVDASVVSTRSTAAVDFSVDIDGFMTCQVFSSTFTITSVDDVLFTGTTVQTANLRASFSFAGLYGATPYKLACVVQTTGGRVMSLATVLDNVIGFTTECCKAVNVRMLQSDIRMGDRPLRTAAITLDSLPSTSVVLKALLNNASVGVLPTVPITAMANDIISFGPHYITVDSTDLNFGSYFLSVMLSGDAADEFEVVFLDSDGVLTVRSLYDEPTTPVLLSAVLTFESTSITIGFSGATDQGASLNGIKLFLSNDCSDLFGVSTGTRGISCQWSSDQEVRVSFSSNHQVSAATTFTLKDNRLKAKCIANADCSTWDFITSKSVVLTIPATIRQPAVSLNVPLTLGRCMALNVDVDQSTGSVGKSWKSVAFSIGGRNTSSAEFNATGFLATRPKYTQPFEMPETLFIPGNKYSLRAEVCNYWGSCGSASRTIIAVRDYTPSVSIVGASPRFVQRYHPLSLRASLQLPSCNNITFPANLQYTWSVLNDGVPAPGIVSTSDKNPARFVLDKYTLDVGHTYTIAVIVVDSDTGGSSSAKTVVVVAAGSAVLADAGAAASPACAAARAAPFAAQ